MKRSVRVEALGDLSQDDYARREFAFVDRAGIPVGASGEIPLRGQGHAQTPIGHVVGWERLGL